MELYFAPMEGVTTARFRRVHRELFGGADRYYMPFISPTSDHRFTPRELREVGEENNAGVSAVSQILTKSAGDFLWAADGLAQMGYAEVDLNLGCPSATVTAKGKGAALLRDGAALDRLLDGIFSRAQVRVSVKTRIGYGDVAEFPALLEIFNRYPISELILHCRTRREMYAGEVHYEAFELARRESRARVCFNGNLFAPADVAAFRGRYPGERAVMLGRGAAADPALFRRLRGGPGASREELQTFHERLYAGYREDYGGVNAMRRMKELWGFMLGLFDGGEQLRRKMMRTEDTGVFEDCVADVFARLALRDE